MKLASADAKPNAVKTSTRAPLAAIAILLSLTACGFDSHEVRTWALPAKHQAIDTSVDQWIPFAFLMLVTLL